MELINRPLYLDKLKAFQNSEFIKVITGMRRCGKSSLLKLFSHYLEKQGIPRTRIIEMNFESAEFFDIADYRDLTAYLHARIKEDSSGERFFILLDEVQLVSQWEKAVNALRVDANADIYLTGSNAYLLSSQLATLLSGRFVEIEVFPLSFSEFISFAHLEECDPDQALSRYLAYGGLPPVVEQGDNHLLAQTVLSGIYGTAFVKDVAQHVQVRNPQVFNDIARFLADTTGSSVSISNIEKRLRSAHRTSSGETVERYIQALVDAFLFYRAQRIDVRGGELLQGLDKYYPADLGIKSMLLGFPERDYGFALENAIHNELKAQGFAIQVGKVDGLEIDFVASRPGETQYVQVSATLLDEATKTRELAPFRKIRDEQGDKLIITYDRIGLGEIDGVRIVNAVDWMRGA